MENLLPSNHQIGDSVNLEFFNSGSVQNCRITKVHFSKGRVSYDVEVLVGQNATRIHNVDAAFVMVSVINSVADLKEKSKRIRLKFNVAEIITRNNGSGDTVTLLPVMNMSPENEAFWGDSVPSGNITLQTTGDEAQRFEKKQYYVDFTKAE